MSFKALIWKYGQGILDAHLDNQSGKIIIDKWKHQTLPEPTEIEIQQAITDYQVFLQQQEQQDQQDYSDIKAKLKTKLGLTEAQFKKFKKVMKKINNE